MIKKVIYLGFVLVGVGVVLFIGVCAYDEIDKRTNYERRFENTKDEFNFLFNRD